jgi:type II secretory pathway pseudopilin PulG
VKEALGTKSPSRRLPCVPRRSSGFSYIGLLIFVVLMGIALAGTGVVWQTEMRREKERELLFVGDQFRRAIGLYYERTPGGVKKFPRSFDDLMLDKRYPNMQRYLRKVYADPVTGKSEWGLVNGPEGGIMGVYSLSQDEPLKHANFLPMHENLAGKTRYNEWVFVYVPMGAEGNATAVRKD